MQRASRGAVLKTNLSFFDELVSTKEMLFFCGPGGVGKTTTAAAFAVKMASDYEKKVLVLTIDPAKRLANALGVDAIGNVVNEVPEMEFVNALTQPKGRLFAAMLDTKKSWDDLIKRHAPDKEVADKILRNPLYHNITSKFVQSHEYIAMERLYDLHLSSEYDIILVDTPPTRNALDFLDAPERMADFFSSRLLRWLIAPYRSRIVNLASRPFYQIADRVLGGQFLQDITDFFILFQSMYEGFVQRAQAVKHLLSEPRCGYVVVTTLEPVPYQEARFFVDEIKRRKLNLITVVMNKVLPDFLRDSVNLSAARTSLEQSQKIADFISKEIDSDYALCKKVLEEMAQSFLNFNRVALIEASLEKELKEKELCLRAYYAESEPVTMKQLKALSDEFVVS